MIFQDRADAGRQLAKRLAKFADRSDVVVLGVPRGGMVVAYEVAAALHLPLDVFLARKLGVPGHAELAFGAVAAGGGRYVDEAMVRQLGISAEQVGRTTAEVRAELDRRATLYRGERAFVKVAGKTVILVDDGVATGASLYAAIKALQHMNAAKLVLAVPVAPAASWEWLGREVDERVSLALPESFVAVGAFYRDFAQVEDAEVLVLLQKARKLEAAAEKDAMAQRLAGVVRRWARPMKGESSDYDALFEMIGDARVVLLGEATHGTREFYRERARITKRLICEKGFNAVALEADWPDAFRVHRYVQGESEDASAAQALEGFKRFPAWMWRNTEMLEFVTWLRKHNDVPLAGRRVGVFGLDLYSLHASMERVLEYLDGVDPEAAQRARSRYACFEPFGYDPQHYGYAAGMGLERSCEDEVVAELMELQRDALHYARLDGLVGMERFFDTEQNALVVRDAEEYYRAMFLRTVSSWNLRDRHMMDTLIALGKFLDKQHPPAKMVVWAHNSHVGDARATQMGHHGEWNIGQLARQTYGRACRSIGFTTYSGTVTAANEWDGPAECKQMQPARAESYEGVFHATGLAAFSLCMEERSEVGFELRGSMLERAIGVVYLPATELTSHYFLASLSQQFDAVVHVDATTAVQPMESESEVGTEPAETFPSGV
ncbi:MAG: erythromycin esterase family protein [Acidobacteriaceae bacterium]